jgi:hypothetical protein
MIESQSIYLTPARLGSLEAQRSRRRPFAQETLGVQRMINQASLVSHSLTAKPANAAHRLPRSEALSECTERAIVFLDRVNESFAFCLLKDSNHDHPFYPVKVITQRSRSACGGSFCSGSKEPREGWSAKHERRGVRRSKNKFTWFSSSDSLSVLSQQFLSAALGASARDPDNPVNPV